MNPTSPVNAPSSEIPGSFTEAEARRQPSGRSRLRLNAWEIAALLIAFALIAFIAMPNYFHALDGVRGDACSKKLIMLSDCLTYLAKQNNTQPGERICEEFDLNELLEWVQNGGGTQPEGYRLPMYYKIGNEPDCPDPRGDHRVSLILGEDGKIVVPTCVLSEGEDGEIFRENGWHVADMSQVDGNLSKYLKKLEEN